jgi:hypothetical protein
MEFAYTRAPGFHKVGKILNDSFSQLLNREVGIGLTPIYGSWVKSLGMGWIDLPLSK